MEKLENDPRIHREIQKIINLAQNYMSSDVSMHHIEKGLLRHLLQLGLVLLSVVIEQKIRSLRGFTPKTETGQSLESKGLKTRKYTSIFGRLTITRPRHWSKATGSYYELDNQLELPKMSTWSYLLQELVGENASENDFEESVRLLNKLLGLKLSGKSSERNASNLGPLVDDFYESRDKEAEDGVVYYGVVYLCGSIDGKGVPKINDKKQKAGNPKKRLGKGEKQGVKQMATVTVTSCFMPKIRSKDSIIRSLMGSPLTKVEYDEKGKQLRKENDNRMHRQIHRRAFLDDQAKAVEYCLDDIVQRMKNPASGFVIPIDAGIGLEDKILAYVDKHDLHAQFDGIILDIIHVSEYVWDAGTAVMGEKSPSRADWVRRVLEDLLDSKTEKVIKDLELIRDKAKLSKNKKKQVQKAITYFSNHKHKMDYKTYLEKGYPVSSALVESACGHLVKERMEQSGMRWSSQGAQNIMDLRAVKLNGDIEDFMEFVIQQEHGNNKVA